MGQINLQSHYNIKDFCAYPVRSLIFILKKLHIRELFKTHVRDPRLRQGRYSLESLLTIGLCHFLFRSQSKNNFYQSYYQGRSYRSLSRLAEIDQEHFPVVKTLDDLFMMLNPNDLEPLLFNLFKDLCRRKLFTHDKWTKGFFLSIDAYCSHCYQEMSRHSPCPFCLKREREDNIWYLHVNVVASLVFPGGFQLPLYVHRLKAQNKWVPLSDRKFKEECELSAFPHILAKIRQYLPRIKLTILLDALYANTSVIELLEQYKMGYAIVLKKLAISKKLEKSNKLQKKVEVVFRNGRFNICQNLKFCKAAHGSLLLNVVDLQEMARKRPSNRFSLIHLKKVHWQWIVHQTLTQDNVRHICSEARLRWRGEDLFNTLKNRGFHATHDFSSNFQAGSIWLFLMMIAFALSSLILYSHLGILARKKGCSIRFFMQQMMQDLLYLSPSLIFDYPYPKQLRFSLIPQAG
jgi:hypothetical protein